MIPDVSNALNYLKSHSHTLEGISRGIEREALRITPNGCLAASRHPKELGSALTHPWITTDFAEMLLEFITPAYNKVSCTLDVLQDLQHYTLCHLDREQLWPFSMPCFVASEDEITIAQYGSSSLGKFKTIYREGLKNRYGALMQIIAGVHYNFSFPPQFWHYMMENNDVPITKDYISDGYLRLIRNYYRFGWIICYLFGASPAICYSFFKNLRTTQKFEVAHNGKTFYLPHATSLRMSDLGYANNMRNNLGITFNTLSQYITTLKTAVRTPCIEFSKLGVKNNGKYRQLNANLLQIENEFYSPIRPKRVALVGESPSNALLRGGIEYVEIRALDINPFSAIGINQEQISFLDIFLIWCALAPSPKMSEEELLCHHHNWNQVALHGRTPGFSILMGSPPIRQPLVQIGEELFTELLRIAELLDNINGNSYYQQIYNKWQPAFTNPSLTYSAQILELICNEGFHHLGLALSSKYSAQLLKEPLTVLTKEKLKEMAKLSHSQQTLLEADKTSSFEEFLQNYLK